MSSPEPKKPDPLVLLARISAAKRRRRILPGLILLVLVAALVGGFFWWVWPRGEYAVLALAAFDQVVLPDERATITVRLEPVEPVTTDARMAGSKLFLQEPAAQDFMEAESGAEGFAHFEKDLPRQLEVIDFVIRYRGVAGSRRGMETRSQVFVWPPEAQLLLVDCDTALVEGDTAALWTTNNLDLKLQAGSAPALQAASRRYRIAYFSEGADNVLRYNNLRAWLSNLAGAPKGALPIGPVLGSASVQDGDREGFAEGTLVTLCWRFRGAGVGVTRNAKLARLFQNAGLETFLMGENAEPPDGVRAVKSWADVQKRLKP